MTVQPTEQWVQMFFLISVFAPGTGPGMVAARALRTDPSWIDPIAARPPTARPDRLRKLRRSTASRARPAVTACSLPRLVSPLLRLISMAPSLLQRLVAVRPIERLDVIGLLVAGLGLVAAGIVGLGLGRGDRRCGGRDGHRDASGGAAPPDSRDGRARSRGHGEGFGFDLHEGAADRADRLVEFRELRGLKVGEETGRPGLEMTLEEAAVGPRGRAATTH